MRSTTEILRTPDARALMPFEQAKGSGRDDAVREKYGDEVACSTSARRASSAGHHVARTGDIGVFKIHSEGGGRRRHPPRRGHHRLTALATMECAAAGIREVARQLRAQPGPGMAEKQWSRSWRRKGLEKELSAHALEAPERAGTD